MLATLFSFPGIFEDAPLDYPNSPSIPRLDSQPSSNDVFHE